MLSLTQQRELISYVRGRLVQNLDPAFVNSENELDINIAHRGFYVGIFYESQELCRVGFLEENLNNIKNSADRIIPNIQTELQAKNVTVDILKKSEIYVTIVRECVYLPDPMTWDENSDGIYFMWGQKYRAMYLPYQIQQMGLSKVNTMDQLCSHEAGVPSTLWKLPEGLIWRLGCQSFKG